MANLCRLTVLAYQFQDVMPFDDFERCDLENGIEYCQALIDEGLTEEPMDHFDLRDYIKWAKMLLRGV